MILGENLFITMPMSLLRSVRHVGGCIFWIASVFLGSSEIPLVRYHKLYAPKIEYEIGESDISPCLERALPFVVVSRLAKTLVMNFLV